MNIEDKSIGRRTFVRGALAAAALIPIGGALASCSGGGGSSSTAAATGGAVSASNPFGVKKGSTINAVIFNGGYGYDYVTFAANLADKKQGTTTKVTPQTNIAQSLQPQFAAGNPPDLVDNSGANLISFNTVASQLNAWDDMLKAPNYEGKTISDTIYSSVRSSGLVGPNNNEFLRMNYVMTVYAMWYSQTLFDENGWKPPTTYDEAMDLGAKAKAKGKYLLVFGKEAATYYLTSMIDTAVKEGGLDVLNALNNLKPKAWSQKAVQDTFNAMKKIVDAGYFIPGGAGTQFTAAQAKWSQDQQAIMYASGGWIENEMKKATAPNFKMTGTPEWTLTTSPKLPQNAIRAGAGEGYINPKGKNPAGGKEVMRAMLSKDAASNFSKTRLAPTVVKGLIPADGFGSTALVSQGKMLDNAGTNQFDYTFIDSNGLNTAQLVVMNAFLSGQMDVPTMTTQLQQISDQAAAQNKS